jgi:glycosyltransferase involved in cell wall biosynthesis
MYRFGTSALLVQYTAPPLSRVPTVVAVHDLSFEDPRAREWLGAGTRIRYRATIRASVRRAAHVLTLSQATRADVIRLYGVDPSQVTVAPAAVDPAFAALLAGDPEPRDGPKTVLVVGNVLPRKNLVVAARAVRLLRDRGLDVRLRVVGAVPPEGRASAAEMSSLLDAHVEFAGYANPKYLAQCYRTSQALAFPSLFEGFGIPVLEAMSAGLPVVVSDRTSLPEVVGGAGLVVPAEDVEAWADALGRALDPGAAADLKAAGLRRSRDFSWDAAATIVGAVLQGVAGHSGRWQNG